MLVTRERKLGNFGGRRGTLLARSDKTLLRDDFLRLTRKTSKAVLYLPLYEEMQAESWSRGNFLDWLVK